MGIINDPSKLQSEEIQHPANSSTQKVSYLIYLGKIIPPNA